MAALKDVYRPMQLDEVIGNKIAKETLSEILSRDPKIMPRTFLLTGPRGCGKTTFAYIIGTMLGVFDPEDPYNPDFREYDAGTTRGIDTVRQIREECGYAPQISHFIVFFLDEAHQLTKDGQEGLLKTLEHVPEHVFFILATTDPDKLTETVRSRCINITVKPLIRDEILQLLEEVLIAEELSDFPPSILNKIAEVCEGIPREALQMLEKVVGLEEASALEALDDVTVNDKTLADLCQVLIDSNITSDEKWERAKKVIGSMKDSRGETDPEKMRRGILTYLHKVRMNSTDHGRIAHMINIMSKPIFSSGVPGLVNNIYYCCYAGTIKSLILTAN